MSVHAYKFPPFGFAKIGISSSGLAMLRTICTALLVLALTGTANASAATLSPTALCDSGNNQQIASLKAGLGLGTHFENAITFAAATGNVAMLHDLIRHATQQDAPDYLQRWLNAALFQAIRGGHYSAAALLIHSGAQANVQAYSVDVLPPEFKYTSSEKTKISKYVGPDGLPLANAVQCVHPRITALLLDHGADMYAAHGAGFPSFHGIIVVGTLLSGSAREVSVFIHHGLKPCLVQMPRPPLTLAGLATRLHYPPHIVHALQCTRDPASAYAVGGR